MIFVLTKSKKTYTFQAFLNTWGGDLKKKISIIPIEKFVRQKLFLPGIYILTDFDILGETQTSLLSQIYSILLQFPEKFKLINNPLNALPRIELLEKLFNSGLNSFRCIPSSQKINNLKFPVFVRKGKDHYGKITGLITSEKELNNILFQIEKEGFKRSEILITEFVDTKDENNIFSKYSAFCVGNEIIARHIFFSKKWMIKGADFLTEDLLNKEFLYVKNNPHKIELLQIFKQANINYGRIDYALLNGQIVCWEINPNPMIASSSSLKKSKRKRIHDLFAVRFIKAFKNLNTITNGEPVENPLFEKMNKKDLAKEFHFSQISHFFLFRFYHLKSILLFNFYLTRNKIRK